MTSKGFMDGAEEAKNAPAAREALKRPNALTIAKGLAKLQGNATKRCENCDRDYIVIDQRYEWDGVTGKCPNCAVSSQYENVYWVYV